MGTRPENPPRLVCRCLRVSSLDFVQAARRARGRDLAAVQALVPAGLGCASCHPELLEILADLNGETVASGQRDENRRVCHEQTERRVSEIVYGPIELGLPDGVQLELLGIDGLTVHLQLLAFGCEGVEALRDAIVGRIRKLVCPGLDVRFDGVERSRTRG